MREIILNDGKLRQEEIEEYKRKVRALIIDDDNMVTLCNYHDVYMLPGGKIEDGEMSVSALKRELREELGIDFTAEELQPLVKIVNMEKDYPIRNGDKKINRLCQTDYYLIRTNKRIDEKKVHLTESEIEHRFRTETIPLNRVLEVTANNIHWNKRNLYFFKELVVVSKEYMRGNFRKFYPENKDGNIDLHIHTIASDGEFSANEIVEMAIQQHAQAISITDHDTVLGYDQLFYDKDKIMVIPGIELSAYIPVGRLHILGYGIDIHNQMFRDKLEELHQNSIMNVLMLTEILKKDYGIAFCEKDILNLTQLSRHIGRPDLAKLMMKDGLVGSVQEAFDRYLIEANNKINDNLKKPSALECFEIIRNADGIPVLAHPHSMLMDDKTLFEQIFEMKKAGLQGIEAYHSNVPKRLSEKLVTLAMEEKLYLTGGSDYHGIIAKPDIELFSGKNNNIKIKKLRLIDDLKK